MSPLLGSLQQPWAHGIQTPHRDIPVILSDWRRHRERRHVFPREGEPFCVPQSAWISDPVAIPDVEIRGDALLYSPLVTNARDTAAEHITSVSLSLGEPIIKF